MTNTTNNTTEVAINLSLIDLSADTDFCSYEIKSVTRSTLCPDCGLPMVEKKAVVYTPTHKKQNNGNGGRSFHVHCFMDGAVDRNASKNDPSEVANNCKPFKVMIIAPFNYSAYFTYNGMKRECTDNNLSVFTQTYYNNQSAGVVVNTAIKKGCIVKIQRLGTTEVYTATATDTFDSLTKYVNGTRTK